MLLKNVGTLLGGGGPGLNYLKGKRPSSHYGTQQSKNHTIQGTASKRKTTQFAVKEYWHRTSKAK